MLLLTLQMRFEDRAVDLKELVFVDVLQVQVVEVARESLADPGLRVGLRAAQA